MPLGARELWGCSTCSSLGAVPRWVSWGFLAHAHSLSLEGPPCRGWSCCHLRVGTACGPDRRSLSRLRSPRLSSGSLCALRLVQTGPPGTRRGRRGARLPGAQSKRSCFLRPCFLLVYGRNANPAPSPHAGQRQKPLCASRHRRRHLFTHKRDVSP